MNSIHKVKHWKPVLALIKQYSGIVNDGNPQIFVTYFH